MMILILAAVLAPATPAKVAARASTVVVTAPQRSPEWESGETAERYRLRDLPPRPRTGRKAVNPLLRISF